ncbi:hypothetical protein [Streptomyces sp. NPDC001292]|uniref:hypothetical protein n=1 Tax=Streptomyces sp. NPDC001292 TaxID=3364558 RepID=UPI00368299FC
MASGDPDMKASTPHTAMPASSTAALGLLPDLSAGAARVAQRVLTPAAAIWHNFRTGQAVSRSLTVFDH